MGPLVDQLGGKVAGQLIRSEDWNALVDAIEGIQTELTERIDGLEASVDERVGALDGRVATLEALRDRVEPLLAEYVRVDLSTSALTYALGQTAELRAQVRDLEGNPIAFADADRPWIDFVATWGRLGAVGGFETLGGAADRSLSVRTNAAGEARVVLRAEVGDDDEPDDEIGDTLTTHLPAAGLSLSQAILTASTPAEAKSSGAFTLLSQQYDQPASIKVRSYVDAYYVKYAPQLTGKIVPPVTHRWRDTRTTVLAIAKRDADPLTPDQGRGASAIQVHFRDWIGPWLLLDYVATAEIGKLVPFTRDQLAAKVTGDLVQSTLLVKEAAKGAVRQSGLVGKLRDFQVVNEALDQLSVPEHATIVPAVTKAIKQAVGVQQALEQSSAVTIGSGDGIALEAIAETSVRADSNVAGVQGRLQTLEQTVGKVDSRIGTVQEKVGSLDGKVTTTLGTTLQRLDADLKTVSGKVEVLKELDPSNVRTKLVELDGISNRVSALERG